MPASGKFEIFSVVIILQTLTPNKWIHNSCILKTCWAIIRLLTNLPNSTNSSHKGKVPKKFSKKKITSVSFMYVCVAENGEMLVFSRFFFLTIV